MDTSKVDRILDKHISKLNAKFDEYSNFLHSPFSQDLNFLREYEVKRIAYEKECGNLFAPILKEAVAAKVDQQNLIKRLKQREDCKNLFENQVLGSIIREQYPELNSHIFAHEVLQNYGDHTNANIIQYLKNYQELQEQDFDRNAAKNLADGMSKVYSMLSPVQAQELGRAIKNDINGGNFSPQALSFHNELSNVVSQNKDGVAAVREEIHSAYQQNLLPQLMSEVIENDLKIPLEAENLREVKAQIRSLFEPIASKSQLNRIERSFEKMIIDAANDENQNPYKVRQGLLSRVRQFCSKAVAYLSGYDDSKVVNNQIRSQVTLGVKGHSNTPTNHGF